MFPSRCSQLPWTNSAVSGVSQARGLPVKSSSGTTPQRRKWAVPADSSSSPVP